MPNLAVQEVRTEIEAIDAKIDELQLEINSLKDAKKQLQKKVSKEVLSVKKVEKLEITGQILSLSDNGVEGVILVPETKEQLRFASLDASSFAVGDNVAFIKVQGMDGNIKTVPVGKPTRDISF